MPKGRGRILLVDDELSIRNLFGQILNRLGYTTTCQSCSLEALNLFKSQPDDFDLVITDMTMPDMTGDQLASKIMEIRSDIPIILCTGYSKIISEQQALKAGIRAFVMKPIVVKELAQTVHHILKGDEKG